MINVYKVDNDLFIIKTDKNTLPALDSKSAIKTLLKIGIPTTEVELGILDLSIYGYTRANYGINKHHVFSDFQEYNGKVDVA